MILANHHLHSRGGLLSQNSDSRHKWLGIIMLNLMVELVEPVTLIEHEEDMGGLLW